ncbi:hypothetical protein BKA62DRAFT_698671 [Auriculariales sp. MPI-PUGE-AT-0066]|nr:hypothetical protein BKA62DRAFT_698671 [Auriculariales sp. MPI-PUGE-AT-0066]
MSRFKLIFFVPRASTQLVPQSLFRQFPQCVGRIGLYAFVTPGTGQYRPLASANPAIGSTEFVEEDRVEALVTLQPSDTAVGVEAGTRYALPSQII